MMWPFGKKKTVTDLSVAELDTERIRLEEEERRIITRLQKVEDEKKRLFQQGTKEPAQRQKIVIARKIKEIDEQGRELDARASMISKQLRVVNRFASVQRNKKKLQESGVWSVISSMSAEELDGILTGEVVRETVDRDKVQALLDVIESDPRAAHRLDEDEDIMRIVGEMELASESSEIDERYSGEPEVLNAKEKDTE